MSRRFLVVIADSPFETSEKEEAILGKIGASVQRFTCSNESQVISAAKNAHVVLCDASPITRNVIMNLQQAVGIVEYGVGYDNIDVNAATEKGIVVCNLPDFMTSEVADHTVALVLALARKLHQILPSTRSGEWTWSKFRPIESLDSMTAGIIGFGNIGRQVATRLSAFGMKIVAYDPYILAENVRRLGATPATLEELLTNSDIVSIHVPLTNETRHLIGKRELAMMKKSSILINASRGHVIDQEALLSSLREKQIRAAGLDVLATEPPDPSDPLLMLDNVIITPHMAWYSEQSSSRLQEHAGLEAERILTGQTPRHPVNPQVLSERTAEARSRK